MLSYLPDGTYRHYTETERHFAPSSEAYTGADSLITAQVKGWCLSNIVYEETIELHGGRNTSVYYFKLVRDSEEMIMPIIANPFIVRMIMKLKILVIPAKSAKNETQSCEGEVRALQDLSVSALEDMIESE